LKTAELNVLATANPNNIRTVVETDEATPGREFMDGLDQPSNAGTTPSLSRSYLILESKKVLADYKIDCILPIKLPETS
jgi:hypothetical protein